MSSHALLFFSTRVLSLLSPPPSPHLTCHCLPVTACVDALAASTHTEFYPRALRQMRKHQLRRRREKGLLRL